MIDEKNLIEEFQRWQNQCGDGFPGESINIILDVIINKIKAFPKVGGWIPCSERLPEPEKEVLLQFENNMVVGFFFVEGGHFDGTTNWYGLADDDCYTDCDAKPIAWMPLPEPYKSEQKTEVWQDAVMKHFVKVE